MTKNLSNYSMIRNIMYNIMITNISGSSIIQTIMLELCKKTISDKQKKEIINIATKYEHNISIGRRDIIHLDGFIVNVIQVLT